MSLEEKLRQIAEQSERAEVNWQEVRDEWIAAVEGLYREIEEWFSVLVAKGYITIRPRSIARNEEYLGAYEINALEIRMGETTVVLEPVARQVIGALGRIDVFPLGYRDDALFLVRLERLDGTRLWELRQRKDTGFRKDFSKEVFEQLLENWL